MGRKKIEGIDFLKKEPHRSIINILTIAIEYGKKHKYFSYGLKTGELMHLLIKGYKFRYRRYILDDFKKHLEEKHKDRVKLNQSIAGAGKERPKGKKWYPNAGFNTFLGDLDKYWIERGEKSRIQLKEERKIQILRTWQLEFIEKCSADNTWRFWNFFVYHPYISASDILNIKLWGDEDIVKFQNLMVKYHPSYPEWKKHLQRFGIEDDSAKSHPTYALRMLFDRIGLRKANVLWKEFLTSIDVTPLARLYFYLNIVYFHYSRSISPINHILNGRVREKIQEGEDKKLKVFVKRNREEFQRGNLQAVKKISKKFSKFYELDTSVVSEEDQLEWSQDLWALFDEALFKYIRKKNMKFNRDSIDKEIKKYADQFKSLRRKSVIERVKMGHYTIVMHPTVLGEEELNAFDNFGNQDVSTHVSNSTNGSSPFSLVFSKRLSMIEMKLLNKMKLMMNSNSLDDLDGGEKKESLVSFFEQTDFLKGFEKELNLLGYDNRYQLYKELHDIATAFDAPIVKEVKK